VFGRSKRPLVEGMVWYDEPLMLFRRKSSPDGIAAWLSAGARAPRGCREVVTAPLVTPAKMPEDRAGSETEVANLTVVWQPIP
jgi:hypothetical protein